MKAVEMERQIGEAEASASALLARVNELRGKRAEAAVAGDAKELARLRKELASAEGDLEDSGLALRGLRKQLENAREAERLAEKDAFVAYVDRLAKAGVKKAQCRVELFEEFHALGVELGALTVLIREANSVGREIGAPKIIDPVSTTEGKVPPFFRDRPTEQRIAVRAKELRTRAAA